MEPVVEVQWPEKQRRFIPPQVFLKALKEEVVGQDSLKPKLAHAFSHYTAFLDDHSVGKALPLIYGPSGAGKTYSIELCAEIAELPMTAVGGGGVSPAGYKGTTLRDLITQHFLEHRVNEGVIFVDEVDKWTKGYLAQQGKPDSEAVAIGLSKQAESLRYMEHESISFVDEGKDYEELKGAAFDTGGIFWIFAGAFTGLVPLIQSRTGQEQIAHEDIWSHAEPADFVKFGIQEEFANRISVWAHVKELKGHEVVKILDQQDRPKWERLFEVLGCKLILEPGALAAASTVAIQGGRGSRGAKMLLNKVMGDVYSAAGEHGLTTVTVDSKVMYQGHLEIPGAV